MTQTRGTLDKELGKIQDKVLQLGSLLEEAIRNSVAALRDRDIELARQVIANDVKLNQLRYSIEEQCLTVIATQQPVASDLRMIIAAMHVAIEMERMGDHAEGIAHLVIRMGDEPLLKPLIDIPRMADIACEMLRSSLDAFLSHDTAAAQAAANRDDEIDQLYEQVMRELLTYMLQDPTSISRGTYLLWVAHNLERIGDRVTNISERVVFLNTGKFKELSGTWQKDEPPP
jgi:phosphate transport system protein